MNLAAPFIRRPVATTLVMASILIFGLFGYRTLPVSDLPNVDFPTLLVSATLPGANPETMASSVATPLERQFSTVAGLTAMNSINALGTTQITLQFELSRDIDAAAQDVQAAITQAGALLPPGMPSPPTFRKANPADMPILYVALMSDTLPPWKLNEYADTLMAQRISMVSGVAQIQVFGVQKYAVRVKLDPRRLASRGVGIDEVERAVRGANVNLPSGILQGPDRALTLRTQGQLLEAEAYRPIVVAYRNGSPVRLEELGRVVDSVEDDRTVAWFGDATRLQRAIILAIQRQPGSNTVQVADAVKAVLPGLIERLPPSVQLHIMFDRSQSIRESVSDVTFTMLLAVALVVMVIFVFLRNVSATLIPSLALPLSVVGTFGAMYPFGYSVDNLSLMALTLSIGFVVDDAIVVLENIVRHREMGESPTEAAFQGSEEIGFTIVSMTLSLAAVFLPILFLPGLVGRLFREFAVTISCAILISGFVSLSLTPMLCSRFLRHDRGRRHGSLYRATESLFDGLLRLYRTTLVWVLRHRRLTMAASLLVLAATVHLFGRIPKGFIPDEDQGMLFGVTEAAQGTSFEQMVGYQRAIAEIVRGNANVQAMFTSVVGTNNASGSTTNQGRMVVRLKPHGERPSLPACLAELRAATTAVPGMRAFLQQMPTIRIGGQLTKSQYQYTLQSGETEELYRYAQELEAKMRASDVFQDVTSDLQMRNPQIEVTLLRDRASALGLTAEQIEGALYSAYGDRWISTIYAPNNQYRVVLELEDEYQRDPAALSLLHVRSAQGKLVPLDATAEFREGLGPLTVNHSGQLPAVTISFNLPPGVALGEAVGKIDALARDTLPGSIHTSFQGTAQAFQSSFTGLWLLVLGAIAVIYIVLGILYESFLHPLTILSGLPSAGFGALVTLMLFGSELNVYGFVGLIMLIGIVKKNAIMQIDFALDAQRNEGKEPAAAILEGCLIRFRPIMMTTMAALLGALPIALGIGAGAEARRPLGLAVVGGLLFSQLVTLYLTPVYYLYLEALSSKVAALRARRRARHASA